MRLTVGIAIAVFALAHAASAEPTGPDAQTLVWWQAEPRSGRARELPSWARTIGQETAIPAAATLGNDSGFASIVGLAIAATCDGLGVAGEALASEDPSKPGVRGAWVRIDMPDKASGERLLRRIFAVVDSRQPRPLGDAQVFTAALQTGDPKVLWMTADDRVVVATTEQAMIRATAGPAPSEPGTIQLDYSGLVKARESCRPNRSRALTIYLGINALRHEFESSFTETDLEEGRGSRLLRSWQISNARGAALFVGYAPPTTDSGVDPTFVHLDIAYSSRAEEPGVGHCTALTEEGLTRKELVLRPLGASTLLKLARGPRSLLDWAIRTYRATLPTKAADTEFGDKWRSWLVDNRPLMADAGENLQKQIVVGLDGIHPEGDHPESVLFPFRIGIVSGVPRQQTVRQIGSVTKTIGAFRIGEDGAGACWRVPFTLPQMHGSVAWTDQRFGDAGVVAGMISIGDADPVKLLLPPPKPSPDP